MSDMRARPQPGLIPAFLQDDLAEELKTILKDVRLKDTSGELVPINIYLQQLPVQDVAALPDAITDEMLEEGTYHNPETLLQPFPYLIVRLESGGLESPTAYARASVTIIIGVTDSDYASQGHKDVLGVMQRICERFEKHPVLARSYECVPPIRWALSDEDTHPFFFGALSVSFEYLSLVREDPYT